MDKKQLSESHICDKFIRPAMEAAGWNGMDQIYRKFPLRAGRVEVRGQKSGRDTTTVVRAELWDVTYNFRGQEHRVQMTTQPGARIIVNQDGEPRV